MRRVPRFIRISPADVSLVSGRSQATILVDPHFPSFFCSGAPRGLLLGTRLFTSKLPIAASLRNPPPEAAARYFPPRERSVKAHRSLGEPPAAGFGASMAEAGVLQGGRGGGVDGGLVRLELTCGGRMGDWPGRAPHIDAAVPIWRYFDLILMHLDVRLGENGVLSSPWCKSKSKTWQGHCGPLRLRDPGLSP